MDAGSVEHCAAACTCTLHPAQHLVVHAQHPYNQTVIRARRLVVTIMERTSDEIRVFVKHPTPSGLAPGSWNKGMTSSMFYVHRTGLQQYKHMRLVSTSFSNTFVRRMFHASSAPLWHLSSPSKDNTHHVLADGQPMYKGLISQWYVTVLLHFLLAPHF